MKKRLHGLISILIILSAFVIAGYSIIKSNLLFGLSYFVLIPIMFLIVIYSYCRKCPHVTDNTCRHIILGKIAKFMGIRKPEKYTVIELLGTILPLLFLIIYPQYWLWQNTLLLIIFYALFIIGGLEVKLFVCKGCLNTNCLGCPQKKL